MKNFTYIPNVSTPLNIVERKSPCTPKKKKDWSKCQYIIVMFVHLFFKKYKCNDLHSHIIIIVSLEHAMSQINHVRPINKTH